MHDVLTTKKFDKQVFKLIENDLKLEKRINRVYRLLQDDPHNSTLRLHKLNGRDIWSVRVTGDLRIILHWVRHSLYCLQIGTHDEVY